MLANVIKSPAAIQASIMVVRAFINMRAVLAEHNELSKRIDALERRCDARFKTVFDALRELVLPTDPPRRRIGFSRKDRP